MPLRPWAPAERLALPLHPLQREFPARQLVSFVSLASERAHEGSEKRCFALVQQRFDVSPLLPVLGSWVVAISAGTWFFRSLQLISCKVDSRVP